MNKKTLEYLDILTEDLYNRDSEELIKVLYEFLNYAQIDPLLGGEGNWWFETDNYEIHKKIRNMKASYYLRKKNNYYEINLTKVQYIENKGTPESAQKMVAFLKRKFGTSAFAYTIHGNIILDVHNIARYIIKPGWVFWWSDKYFDIMRKDSFLKGWSKC